MDRRAPWVWAALIVPTWLVLVACTHWEPMVRDGWGHFNWHQEKTVTLANIWDFARGSYLHNNPRLGQVLTMLVYTPGPWHSIVTPVAELFLFWLLATLALGRVPSWNRLDDALMFATILAMAAVAVPQLGPMLFYRPFTGNYLFGWTITLALLVRYRLHAESPRAVGWWWIPIQLVLGAAAGLSNEHTAPAVAALAIVAVIAFVRRGERPALWMIAGIVGLLIGGVALYYAPGQEVRYNGLANQASLLERIGARELHENAMIVVAAFQYAWRVIAWIALAAIARWLAPSGERPSPESARGDLLWTGEAEGKPIDKACRFVNRHVLTRARALSIVFGFATAVAILLTLLASPKQGPRLYFAPITLMCAAIASWVVPMLAARWTRAIAWLLAATSLCYAGWRLVPIYRELDIESRARNAQLAHAAPNSTVTVPAFSQPLSRWFLGDDFVNATARANVAAIFGLTAIVVEAGPAQLPATVVPDDP